MSTSYRLVQWNRHKKVYDLTVALGVVFFAAAFVVVSIVRAPTGEVESFPVLLMRSLGVTGAILLHVILAIGPLARLSPRFAPLLYNRRHLGVIFFLVVLMHFLVAVGYYGGFGVTNPFVAILSARHRSGETLGVPFEAFGFGALIIFFLMAATSHDFWLHTLGANVWKWLHMSVYLAYALVVLHVVFGVVQGEASSVIAVMVGVGVAVIASLHIVAGFKQLLRERGRSPAAGWIDAGEFAAIPESRARIVRIEDGREIAVFRRGDSAHAVSNRCIHQGGPLGEGQIIDGCVTCPWHGYQFDPETGCSPPPFTDRVPTYQVRIESGRVMVNPEPNTEASDA